MGVWVHRSGGVKTESGMAFNWHPILMTIFLFLYGNGVLVYRLMRHKPKKYLKAIHATLNGLAGICVLVAVSFMFYNRRNSTKPNLYSLHSWIGFSTFLLYKFNFIFGLISFVVKSTPQWIRNLMMPFHTFIGQALLAMAVTALMTGTLLKSRFTDWGDGKEHDMTQMTYVVNFYGFMIMLFAILVGFLVIYSPFKRRPLVNESI